MAAAIAIAAANSAFVDEDYEVAVQHYGAAIAAEPQNGEAYSKRAAAQLKLKRYTEAVSDATASVKLQATSKAYARKGQASFALGEFEAARDAFGKAAELLADGASGAVELRRWMRKCNAEILLESAPPPPAPAPSAAPPVAINPMAPPPPVAPSAAASADPSRIRHEWYQTQTHVIVSVLAKGVTKEQVAVDFSDTGVDVGIKLESASEYQLTLGLFQKVIPAECKYSVNAAKVELKLKKLLPGKWEALEGTGEAEVQSMNAAPDVSASEGSSVVPSKKVYSGSSKNWDAIEVDLKKKEEEEKPEGEEALNKLFRDIYGRADEDTRRAMNKSFQTSGGTVLSTNWGEVSEKDYEKDRDEGKLEAPSGQEWKKWG